MPPTEMQLQARDLQRLGDEQNRQKFSKLLNSYDTLVSLVSLYFRDVSNTTPRMTLDYTKLRLTTDRLMRELRLRPEDTSAIKISRYCIPFQNLLAAEKDYHEMGKSLDVREVLREMNAALGEMKTLVMEIGAVSDIPDDEIEDALENYRGLYGRVSDLLDPGPKKKKAKTRLADCQISFDDEQPAIVVDDKSYPLPAFTMAHYLARIMFGYRAGEAVDWTQVEGQIAPMLGQAVDERALPTKRRKRLWDAADRLNERIQEVLPTADSLIQFEGRTIRRLY